MAAFASYCSANHFHISFRLDFDVNLKILIMVNVVKSQFSCIANCSYLSKLEVSD